MPHNGQPQPGALPGGGVLPAIEGLKELVQLLLGDGRAVIGHPQGGVLAHLGHLHPNLTPGGGVFDGVGEQVFHHLGHAAPVGQDGGGCLQSGGQPQPLGLQGGGQLFQGGAGELGQGEILSAQLYPPCLQPGQVQKLQHHAVHPLRLAANGGQVLLPLVLGDVLLQPLGVAVNHRQGGFQLVGHVAGEGAAVLLGGFGIGEGLVEPLNLVLLLPPRSPVGLELLLKFVAFLPAAHLAGAQQQPLLPGVQGLGQLLDGGEQLTDQHPPKTPDEQHAQAQGEQVHPPQALPDQGPQVRPHPAHQNALVRGDCGGHQQVGPAPQLHRDISVQQVRAQGLHQLGQAVIPGSPVGEGGGFRGATGVIPGGVEGDGLRLWVDGRGIVVDLDPGGVLRPCGPEGNGAGGEDAILQDPLQAQGLGVQVEIACLHVIPCPLGETGPVQDGPGIAARGLHLRLIFLLGEILQGEEVLPAAPQGVAHGIEEAGGPQEVAGAPPPPIHLAPGQGGLDGLLPGLVTVPDGQGVALPLGHGCGEQPHTEKPGHQHHQAQKPGEGGPGTGTAFFGVCHVHPSNR